MLPPARRPKALHSRLCALAGAAMVAMGCGKQTTMAVVVFGPDGGDPFLPPDAATQARLTVDDNATEPRTVPVASNGAFSLEVNVGNPNVASRIVLEALANGAVVGGGATPPVKWGAIGPAVLPVFVQRSNTLVPAPWGDVQVARTSPLLVELADNFVAALGGATDTATIDVMDVFGLRVVTGATTLDGMFNRDAAVLRLGNGTVLAVRGCMALNWNPTTNQVNRPTSQPPEARCDILGSTVVQEPGGGGLILGGRNAMGPVARVDQVLPDGTFQAAPAMATPRDQPAAARIGAFQVLLAGGHARPGDVALEQYGVEMQSPRRALPTGDVRVDARTATTLVSVGSDIVLMLGGTVTGSTDLAAEDAVLDARCVGGACPLVVSVAPLLSDRRRGAQAVRSEGRVLVASGVGVGGPVRSLERIDTVTARMPVARGRVATLDGDGWSLLPLTTGSVLFVGGGGRHTFLYR